MPKRNLIWIIALLVAGIVTVWVTHGTGPGIGSEQHFESVFQAYRQIHDSYYPLPTTRDASGGPVKSPTPSDDELRQGAVRGMVASLNDEFSIYIAPGDQDWFDRTITGRRRGFGVRIEQVEGQYQVLGIVRNSPALRAGITPGERLSTIDGQSVADKPLKVVRRLLEAKVGVAVAMGFLRHGAPDRVFNLVSEEIPVETVQGLYRDDSGDWTYLFDPDFGLAYVRIAEFVPTTADRLQQALRGDPRRVQGLVLDLRDNPGGFLEQSVAVANMFIDEGVIVTTVGRGGLLSRYTAHPGGKYPDFNIVVLINAQTASAAEIVAGALAFHDRAIVVGTRSRGKGCIQKDFKLEDGLGSINLTVGEYLIGGRFNISRHGGNDTWGIDPHVEVSMSDARHDELTRRRLIEELAPPPTPATAATRPTTSSAASPASEFLRMDPQLAEAARLLQHPADFKRTVEQARKARLERLATTRPADDE